MKVFKFGGASLSSSEAVKNMAGIIRLYSDDKLLIVVSAMGKTTNHLENIIFKILSGKNNYEHNLDELVAYHVEIINNLFSSTHQVHKKFELLITELTEVLSQAYDYNKFYDQVVCYGELISSHIVASYLQEQGNNIQWLDARDYITTDDHYRFANVKWNETTDKIYTDLKPRLASTNFITQGFIGRSSEGLSTTLGREGSDYTGAIFATGLKAESLTVWKDVPGILNADPKLVDEVELYDELPYREASEMTYYGAKVIHPKTIRPLANNNIPLYVKSFEKPREPGTKIHDCGKSSLKPTIIVLKNQCLLSFHVLDFTFIEEANLSRIFSILANHDIKINIMQNSAISFSIVIDNEPDKVKTIFEKLEGEFKIDYKKNLTLITLKNYTEELLNKYRNDAAMIVEQKTREHYRLLIGTSSLII